MKKGRKQFPSSKSSTSPPTTSEECFYSKAQLRNFTNSELSKLRFSELSSTEDDSGIIRRTEKVIEEVILERFDLLNYLSKDREEAVFIRTLALQQGMCISGEAVFDFLTAKEKMSMNVSLICPCHLDKMDDWGEMQPLKCVHTIYELFEVRPEPYKGVEAIAYEEEYKVIQFFTVTAVGT